MWLEGRQCSAMFASVKLRRVGFHFRNAAGKEQFHFNLAKMSESTAVASASKAMEGVTLSTPVPPPVDASGDVTMGEALPVPTASAIVPPEPGLPPDACETLYIQNLNETVKIDGERCSSVIPAFVKCTFRTCLPNSLHSHKDNSEEFIQALRPSSRRYRSS